ncbi:MAG: gamma-glutamyl-gamma-aminobutyrate hydrolase family protein [Bacteroides sp.]|nr:gamma-glutamyl-gamma-aminobutyrate hydrolase family protein [Bacteroides sp.]
MKLRTLLFALLCSSIPAIQAQDTLLLFHPTAYNLDLMDSLVQQGLLDLEGYHILGVYHSGEAYSYESALEKASEHPDGIFSLQEIKGQLGPEVVYEVNACTPIFEKLFNKSEGALFLGGPDIPPAMYNEAIHLLTNVTDPYRHYLEASFIFHLLGGHHDPSWLAWMKSKNHYLISGICLGMQTMNVATGGTMIQDIPSEVYGVWTAEEILDMPTDQVHRNYIDMLETDCAQPTSYHFHQVELIKGSFLQKGLKFKNKMPPLVLSSHHQAIESPGMGWEIAATSMDGKIIEAIEHEHYPHVFGVQFHPEKPGLFDPQIVHPLSCKEQISFQEVIKDSDSFTFHMAYWSYLGRILQKSRK